MESLSFAISHLPRLPGVYIFKDVKKEILYVGKAIDLSRRVKSYFSQKNSVSEKTKILISQVRTVETIQTASEFDALLLEARLIKRYIPKYNIIAKDDKSPLYISISISESLPQVTFMRKHDTGTSFVKQNNDKIFGPFQSTRVARTLLRRLRHTVPYCIQHKRTGKGCFYTHLGLCRPCPSIIAHMKEGEEKNIAIKIYRRNIYRLIRILSGHSRVVVRDMDKEMRHLAQYNKFEEAEQIKKQIQAIYQLQTRRYNPDLYIESDTAIGDIRQAELDALRLTLVPYFPNLGTLARIECVDISHLSGTSSTGSLVVLIDGMVDKSQYRRFRIRGRDATDDTSRMHEVLGRRFSHKEWPRPDLLIVDGGKPQLGVAILATQATRKEIPVIGLAKRQEEIIIKVGSTFKTVRLPFSSPALQIVQRIRDEAHRFAKAYHIVLRARSLTVGINI